MFKITGLDELTKQLDEAQQALAAIDGELGNVSFDPEDPQGLELAISEMEHMLDERVGRYADNPFVAPLIEESKEQFRQSILDKAAEARLGVDDAAGDDVGDE